MPRSSPVQKYVVCNSDESEPGTCHDRDILRYNPHSVIEGMAIGGYAMTRDRRLQLHPRRIPGRADSALQAALDEAYAAGLLGKNILGSGVDFDLHMFVGAGAYICGEETALLESLEGKPGKPRFKPPFPANFGLYGKPTTINNTQSYASVPTILRKGAGVVCGPRAAELRRHHDLLGLGPRREAREHRAAARHPVQGPAGDLRRRVEGAQAEGRDPGRLLGAGGAGRYHDGDQHGLRLDEEGRLVGRHRRRDRHGRDDLHGARARAPRRASTCRSPAASARPCREGTGWLDRMLKRIIAGQGRSEDLGLLLDVANRIEGHTICALGDAAAWPVQSFLKHYRHEFQYMIEHKGRSIVEGQPARGGVKVDR